MIQCFARDYWASTTMGIYAPQDFMAVGARKLIGDSEHQIYVWMGEEDSPELSAGVASHTYNGCTDGQGRPIEWRST